MICLIDTVAILAQAFIMNLCDLSFVLDPVIYILKNNPDAAFAGIILIQALDNTNIEPNVICVELNHDFGQDQIHVDEIVFIIGFTPSMYCLSKTHWTLIFDAHCDVDTQISHHDNTLNT